MAEGGGIQGQLDALSPRDRKLLAGLIGAIGLVLVGAVFFTLRGQLSAKAELVTQKKQALELIQAYHTRHLAASARIEAAEATLREYRGQPASAFLERAASTVGVRDKFSVSRQSEEKEGTLQTTRYRVELQRVPIDLSLNYLYDIEVSDYPLEVESAAWRITARSDGKEASLTLEVLAYSLEEAG
jgi:type II secretory pathway component PulM